MSERPNERPDPALARTPLSTRAAPPQPRRLSRKAIIVLTGTGVVGIATALAYSLGGSRGPDAPRETVSVERRQSDLLASAPSDYSDLARNAAGDLGPPSTGTDIAAPLAEPTPDAAETPPTPQQPDPVEERRRNQAESARASRLFAAGEGAGAARMPADAAAPPAVPPGEAGPPPAAPQDRRAAFVAGGPAEPTVNSGRLLPPAGRHVVTAGSTIAAALVTGLSSDLPGQVIAQVTEDVFDSATGRTRLIPQGARLIGTYDANVRTGQNRALVIWTRLILPDGRSLDLDRLIGTDASGQSGFTDRVNNHWGTILRAGLLATLLGVGTQATGVGDNNEIADAIRDSAGQTVGRAGDRIVERELGVQPTITVRPGARVRVLVGRDLVMEAWQGR